MGSIISSPSTTIKFLIYHDYFNKIDIINTEEYKSKYISFTKITNKSFDEIISYNEHNPKGILHTYHFNEQIILLIPHSAKIQVIIKNYHEHSTNHFVSTQPDYIDTKTYGLFSASEFKNWVESGIFKNDNMTDEEYIDNLNKCYDFIVNDKETIITIRSINLCMGKPHILIP